LLSTSGVYPACRSLDCVSVFALTVEDAALVAEIARGFDGSDGYSREAPAGFAVLGPLPKRFAFGVLPESEREFFGDADAPSLYRAAIERLTALGGEAIEIDYAPFLEVNRLLYTGPWLAERYGAVSDAVGERTEVLRPVLREIIAGGEGVSGADVFEGLHRLTALRQTTEAVWRTIDCLVLPTTGTTYRISEIERDPIALNANLGRYTNFCNLLDLSAIAVPVGFRGDGLPFGVTLFAPAFHDPLIAAIGAALHRAAGLKLGATGRPHPQAAPAARRTTFPYGPIAVVGAHLSGQPLNHQLVDIGGRLRQATKTAAEYRLYALPDGRRPGLMRCTGEGMAIDVEVWDVPSAALGGFTAGIAAPLGLGKVKLRDGTQVTGFLCEAHAIEGARDISEFGGWRGWLAATRPSGAPQ
ncbi:MAG TPA: allophanate hydrolase, partial [Stellaceae bacterium]|nr:allophanate hydrolase [Stellaceae bacterium]